MAEAQKKEKLDPERLKIAVDVWKHVVSVQMHFNDMEMKVRNLYFTILAASLGLIGAVKGKRIEMPILGDLSFSLALGVATAFFGRGLLDRYQSSRAHNQHSILGCFWCSAAPARHIHAEEPDRPETLP